MKHANGPLDQAEVVAADVVAMAEEAAGVVVMAAVEVAVTVADAKPVIA